MVWYPHPDSDIGKFLKWRNEMTENKYPTCETEAEALYEAAKVDLGKAIRKLTKIVTNSGMSGREKKNIEWIASRTNELMGIRGRM